jgi:hypothetical protein
VFSRRLAHRGAAVIHSLVRIRRRRFCCPRPCVAARAARSPSIRHGDRGVRPDDSVWGQIVATEHPRFWRVSVGAAARCFATVISACLFADVGRRATAQRLRVRKLRDSPLLWLIRLSTWLTTVTLGKPFRPSRLRPALGTTRTCPRRNRRKSLKSLSAVRCDARSMGQRHRLLGDGRRSELIRKPDGS